MQYHTTINIIATSGKINNVSDIIDNFENIIELLREDVYRVLCHKGAFIIDYDTAYAEAAVMLQKTIVKKHLRGIKKFLTCNNIEDAVKWIIARMTNNVVNITTNSNYSSHQPQAAFYKNPVDQYQNEREMNFELENLAQIDKHIIHDGIKKMWTDPEVRSEMMEDEFEDLCVKYGMDFNDLKNLILISRDEKNQLYLLF